MGRSIDTAGPPQPGAASPAEDRRPRGFGWRRLQVVAALGAIASFLVPMVIMLSFEPFLLAMLAPFVVGLLVMIRWPRVASIWLGIASLGVLLTSAPFLVEALAHPESLVDFLPLVAFTLSTLVGTVAAIPSFRLGAGPDAASRVARGIALAAGVSLVAASLLSVVAFAGVDNVPARADDVLVVTEDIEFAPGSINVEGGSISVHVTNRDDTRHTFTIDELGVDLNVPPSSTQRVSFEAGPGTYRFYCRPHPPDMEGVLVVE